MHAKDLFERITRQIIDAIEAGTGEFAMPWHRWGESSGSPVNAVSGHLYRGINTLLLWAAADFGGYVSGRWATYRQWAGEGAQVREGEKSTSVLFWKTEGRDRPDADNDEDGTRAQRILARVYHVFNAHQVDGADAVALSSALAPMDRIAAADSFFAAVGASVEYGGDQAFYRASDDKICMPRFEQFRDAESFYSVLGHEQIHWTGARHRLARDLRGRFGTDCYAVEELIAELGSAFLSAHLGLSVEPRPDHASYISSWLRVLRNDSRAILTASAKAQEAMDHIVAIVAQPGQHEFQDRRLVASETGSSQEAL